MKNTLLITMISGVALAQSSGPAQSETEKEVGCYQMVKHINSLEDRNKTLRHLRPYAERIKNGECQRFVLRYLRNAIIVEKIVERQKAWDESRSSGNMLRD